MKMVKKILLGTLALAAVLALTSCGEKQDEEKAFNGDKISFVHDGKSGDYYRSFKSTGTKHFSANAKILIDNPTVLAEGSENVSNAGLGFVFGLEEVTDSKNPVTITVKDKNGKETEKTVKFYNFGIASVRYCNKDNKNNDKGAQWYVSWCENVPDTVFNYNNSSEFYDTINSVKYGNEETVLKGTKGAWKTISAWKLTDDSKLSAIIKTVAKEDGSYEVILCDSDEKVLDRTTISKEVTKLESKTQKYIGRYLTVYSGETVTGSIEYSDISGNVIPADYDVVIE